MIIDASAMLDVLLRTERGLTLEPLVLAASTLQAPAIIDVEVAQVLRRVQLAGHLSAPEASRALDAYALLLDSLHPTRSLLERAWSLRASITISDALYVAAAEATGLPLLTTDDKLARVVADQTGVELVRA